MKPEETKMNIDEYEPTVEISWDQLRYFGILWAINRYLFHPRGLALAVKVGEPGEFLMLGDCKEIWKFEGSASDGVTPIDQHGKDAFEKFLKDAHDSAWEFNLPD